MPLTISRAPGQHTVVTINGERVIVALRKISGKRAQLTFYAAPHIKIVRGEVEERDARAAIEETQDIVLPAPFAPGDRVRYRGTTTPFVVFQCYRSAVDCCCHWIVEDMQGDLHYAAKLERAEEPHAEEPNTGRTPDKDVA